MKLRPRANRKPNKSKRATVNDRWLKTKRVPRPPSRRISRRPEKLFGLAAGKIAASRQPDRKINVAKPPPNVRLKAALPRDVNEKLTNTVQGSYDQAR